MGLSSSPLSSLGIRRKLVELFQKRPRKERGTDLLLGHIHKVKIFQSKGVNGTYQNCEWTIFRHPTWPMQECQENWVFTTNKKRKNQTEILDSWLNIPRHFRVPFQEEVSPVNRRLERNGRLETNVNTFQSGPRPVSTWSSTKRRTKPRWLFLSIHLGETPKINETMLKENRLVRFPIVSVTQSIRSTYLGSLNST